MKVTKRTRTRELVPILNESRIASIVETVSPVPLSKPLLEMTCGEFIESMQPDYALKFLKARRAWKAFGRYSQFLNEMKAITRYIESLRVQQIADEKKAAENVNFPSLSERILLDNVKHYHLHSTEEAERLPLTDWLIVLKSESAEAKFAYNLNKIQELKQKKNGGKH